MRKHIRFGTAEGFLVVSLVLLLSLHSIIGLAYFTTYTSSHGEVPIILVPDTELTEEVDGFTKTITVRNTDEKVPAYVRVCAFAPDSYALDIQGENWISYNDGNTEMYAYTEALAPGGETSSPLIISILDRHGSPISYVSQDFNVVVIQEACVESLIPIP